MHILLQKILAFFARIIIKTKKPYIIGVTGTAGKTTISRFIISFLQQEFWEDSVQFSRYNYNGEYGLPLAILWAKSWGKNIFLWMRVVCVFLKKLFTKYPKFLVLEYGIDHPGEMDFLLSIAVPDVAIVTPISSNHIQQFGTFEAYRDEKMKISQSKTIILHESVKWKNKKNSLIYGKSEKNDFFIKNPKITLSGTQAICVHKGEEIFFEIPVFGEFQAENILTLFALADILGINKNHVVKQAKNVVPEAGRSRIFYGKNDSIVIDGTYNGGFLSILEGIHSIAHFAPEYEIILLLGDMRELGVMEAEKHKKLAEEIIKIFENREQNVKIILVGKIMKKYAKNILEKKFDTKVFFSSRLAWEMCEKIIKNSKKKCIIFAKGSQNTIFLEEGIKYIIDEKNYKDLCRQSAEWMQKKEKFFASLEK